jgi:aspartate-semialdehyde dehydrogenase
VCTWQDREIEVRDLQGALPAAPVVLLASAHPHALAAAEREMHRGARVLDLSGAYRGRREVALVAPGTAIPDPGVFSTLVALPQRSTMLGGPMLWSLEQAFGLEELHLALLVSAAGDGARGMNELYDELAGEPDKGGDGSRLGNVLVAPPHGPGREELLERELGYVLGRADLPVDVTALRIDTERCDCLAFQVRLKRPVSPEEVARLLAGLPGVELVGDDELERLTPRACQGSDAVRVGRIRAGSRGAGSVCFFAVGDQLRVGAARAALMVAARFIQP